MAALSVRVVIGGLVATGVPAVTVEDMTGVPEATAALVTTGVRAIGDRATGDIELFRP